jgi:hypothetical protein
MTILSPENLGRLCDQVMAGASMKDAMIALGGAESSSWGWIRKSREAEQQGDIHSIFHLAWPSDATADYLHNLVDRARARRGALISSPLAQGQCVIADGRVVFEVDDFGAIAVDPDNGMPIAKRIAASNTPHTPPRVTVAPPRQLSPASFGTPTKAQRDTMRAPFKPPSPMEIELRAKLAEVQANNPNRITRPNAPVHILGRGGQNDPQERINRPSDATGLPTQMADAPREQQGAVDYSRKPSPSRGFRVA